MRGIIYVWSIAVVMVVGAAVFAQAPAPAPDLTTATLEELMNIEITSVSKKEEKLFRSAAAIYVITQEEIRRSGLTSIPELLRLAPGLQVGRIDGNKWAITSRGFNGRLANKLLALIDGRSLYSPESAGVYWEAQLLPVEEIERIEVIRGPGGTLWGANAVNGVINIITKHAGDSQGGLLTVGSGSEEQGFVSARYDTKIGEEAFYRVYARYFKRSGLVDSIGRDANDGQTAAQGGFRLDWQLSKRDTLTVHGDIYDSHLRETSIVASLSALFKPPSNTQGEFMGGNVTGRWARAISDHSDLALQIYFDRSRREVYDLGERFDTLDVDLQYNLHLGRRQEIVSGIGYRLIADRTNTNIGTPVQLDPKARTVQIFSGFVQDELTLIKDHLRLTLGSKLEHNDYNGFETQPNARLLWTPSTHQVVWAAVSRAVRTPTRNYEDIRVTLPATPGPGGLPIVPTLLGNKKSKTEEGRAYEFGYRIQPGKKLSLDLATFYNRYDLGLTVEEGLPFFEPNPQPAHLIIPLRFDNLLRSETYGWEASANLDLVRRWKVRGSFSGLRVHLHAPSQSTVPEAAPGLQPRQQFQLHSYLKLPRNFELGHSLYYVSGLSETQIPAYTRFDTRLGWRVREGIELSLELQNLLDDRHPEFNSLDTFVVPSQVGRSIYGKMAWRF